MRIIGGKWKGHKIDPPSRIEARPTTDFAREGLFNILNNRVYFEDIRVLDLFAGTGAITFEFLSRGAPAVTAVDKSPLSYTFISRMSNKYQMKGLSLYRADVFNFLKNHRGTYDLVFADPPYDMSNMEDLHNAVINSDLLAQEGTMILEHSERTDLSKLEGFVEQRNYGNVNFSFFTK